MLAPAFKISTWEATIPASRTPSNGIHARPRTTRSSQGWSGRATANEPTRRPRPTADVGAWSRLAARSRFGAFMRCHGAGSGSAIEAARVATAAASAGLADALPGLAGARAGLAEVRAGRGLAEARVAPGIRRVGSCPRIGPDTRLGGRPGRAGRGWRAGRGSSRAGAAARCAAALRAACVSALGLTPRPRACARRAGEPTSSAGSRRSRPPSG